jgi:hypothetical protein
MQYLLQLVQGTRKETLKNIPKHQKNASPGACGILRPWVKTCYSCVCVLVFGFRWISDFCTFSTKTNQKGLAHEDKELDRRDG